MIAEAARTAQQIRVTPRPAERRRAPGHLAHSRRSARSGSTGRDLSLILGAWLSATHLPGTLPSLRARRQSSGGETDRRAEPRDRTQGGAGAVDEGEDGVTMLLS